MISLPQIQQLDFIAIMIADSLVFRGSSEFTICLVIKLILNFRKVDWVNYKEERTIRELLAVGNVGLRTGVKVGNCYFCVLDLDGKG